ncbi:hypothetical protein [Microbacterium sp. KRD172]|uniref:hypothetical protein n=1 Tax=Microbacterium sp. KRD172 TaxID=2729727 RepID=UPI001F49E838|nr:hypothetical protein [Microbacterium sp. KRD172]
MITLLFRTLIYLVSAGIGLIVADLVLPGFQIQWDKWWGFVICIVIFAILQSILSPWITKLADRYAPVLMGGHRHLLDPGRADRRRAAADRWSAHRRCHRMAAGLGDRLADLGAWHRAAAADLPQARGEGAPRALTTRSAQIE